MINTLTIKNFKAIDSLTIDFSLFTMLIGENSSGKSTLLQALDFLCAITTRDIDEYLSGRGWSFADIKSRFCPETDALSFSVTYSVRSKKLTWDISINQDKDDRWIIEESISDADTNQPVTYLYFGSDRAETPMNFSELNLKSSALKTIDVKRDFLEDSQVGPEILHLKRTLSNSTSFELLSPEKMRTSGSRGKVSSIGIGGEKLAAFVHGFNSTKKKELSELVSSYLGYSVKITTTSKGTPGWINLFIEESWPGDDGETQTFEVEKRYVSDGLLRIIAFSAILISRGAKSSNAKQVNNHENKNPTSLILLDEIEDGINPALAEKLVTDFQELSSHYGYQVIVTSHSPIMVNYADEKDIRYMWRDSFGKIHVNSPFVLDVFEDALKYSGPGEIWLNYPRDSFIASDSDSKRALDD